MTIESTGILSTANGVPCRVWIGTTEDAKKCVVCVCLIIARVGDDVSLDAELTQVSCPRELDDVLAEQLPPADAEGGAS